MKTYLIIANYEDGGYWCESVEAEDPYAACQKGLEQCAEENGYELKKGDTYENNSFGWSLVVCIEGDIDPNRLVLWGDNL